MLSASSPWVMSDELELAFPLEDDDEELLEFRADVSPLTLGAGGLPVNATEIRAAAIFAPRSRSRLERCLEVALRNC